MQRRGWRSALSLALLTAGCGDRPHGVVINEVVSANRTAWTDPQSVECPEYDDYIELFNASKRDLDVGGYTLSDGTETWTLPARTIPGGGFLLIVADGDPEQGDLHASFKVARTGETLTLTDARGKERDTVVVPALSDDDAWARWGDGGTQWREQVPSPAAANEAPPDDECFDEREDFDDHGVPCLSTTEGFFALAQGRAGLDVVKFDILNFQDPADRHVVFLDSRFYVLHDEWYIYRMLNGQTVDGEDLYAPYPGEFGSIAEIYAWAASVELPTLFAPEFLRWTNDGRLYSPRYYDLALGDVRIIGVATLVHRAASDGRDERWAFELEASDNATPEEVAAYFDTITPLLPPEIAGDLHWLVRSTYQEALAQQMIDQGLPYADRIMYYDELASTGQVDVYGPGTVAGRVHHLHAGEGLEGTTPEDLLVLDEIPDYLPPGNGLLTAVPQTPLAHIALLAESRGIPNLFVQGIDTDPQWDAWARVRAPVAIRATAPDQLEVVALTMEAFRQWQALSVRPPVNVTPVDVTGAPYTVDLTTLTFADMQDWRPLLGGKNAGLVALLDTPGVIPPPDPLALSIRGYREQMASFPWWDDVLTDPAFAHPGDVRARYLVIEGQSAYDERYDTPADVIARDRFFDQHPTDALGELARGTGIHGTVQGTPMIASVRGALVPAVTARFGAMAAEQPIRFRSSSNIEDAEGFNGAGLYDSGSGYAVPPSGEDDYETAIRGVWGSYWGAEAFEERHNSGIDHRAGDMGVLAEPAFDDDHELANGVITARRLPDGQSDRWEVVFNSQPGAISVTNPPGNTCAPIEPEVVSVRRADDGAPRITRVRHSTELPDGDVLSDAEILALFDQTSDVVEGWLAMENGRVPPEWGRSTLTIDYEWRKAAQGWPQYRDGHQEPERIVLKQARTLEPSADLLPADVVAEPFPRDVLARARVISEVTCTAADGVLSIVEATTDPAASPDMGFTGTPFTARATFTPFTDIVELGLPRLVPVDLTHLEFDITHVATAPYTADVVIDADGTARTGLVAIAVGDTLAIDGTDATWEQPVTCTSAVRWASADTFLSELLDAAP